MLPQKSSSGIAGADEIASGEYGKRAGRLLSSRPPLLSLVLFYAAYVLAGGFGQGLAIIPGVAITFWPPAGIFTALLLVNERRSWPWWILAACLAELTCNAIWFHNPIPFALIYFTANALEALTVTSLIYLLVGKSFRLETLEEVGAFILAAMVAPMVAATVIATTDAVLGRHLFWTAWTLVWLGDGTGLLVSLPLALVVIQTWRERLHISLPRLIESLILLVVFVAIGALSFRGHLPTAFVLMPALLWAAARFQLRGAAAALAFIAVTEALFTVSGKESLAGDSTLIRQNIVLLQIFFGISAVSALIVAVLSLSSVKALANERLLKTELEERVAERTAALRESEARLTMALDAGRAGIWESVPATGEFFASEAAIRLHGLPPGTPMTHEAALAAVHPDDRRRVEMALKETLEKGEPYALDLRAILPDGTIRWLHSQAQLRLDGRHPRLIGLVQDITDRHRHEEQIEILMREVNHRANNMLTLVQAIARRTAAATPHEFVERFVERVQALSASQNVLVQSGWRNVPFEVLVRTQLGHFADLIDRRIILSGPRLEIDAAPAQTIGMALHELATNAAKYGALSNESGVVTISWQRLGDGDASRFTLSWIETGGPPVQEPTRRSFGSVVTADLVEANLAGEVEITYAPEGFRWQLSCAAERVIGERGLHKPLL